MSWASRRKTSYLLIVFAALVLIAAPLVYYFYPTPTCTDGRKDGDEKGIDCGGACTRACVSELSPLQVSWARAFPVASGVVSVTAYITNPNFGAAAIGVPYTFKVYDKDGILLAQRSGSVDIPPNVSFPIFEPLVSVGNRVVARTFFQFASDPVWVTIASQPAITVLNAALSGGDSAPRLEADVSNPGISSVPGISVVAVIYDDANQAIATSKTSVGVLAGGASKHVVFTWPEAFSETVSRFEIYPEFLVH